MGCQPERKSMPTTPKAKNTAGFKKRPEGKAAKKATREITVHICAEQESSEVSASTLRTLTTGVEIYRGQMLGDRRGKTIVFLVDYDKFLSEGPRSLRMQVVKVMNQNTCGGKISFDKEKAEKACVEGEQHGHKFLGPLMCASGIVDGKVHYKEVKDERVGPTTLKEMYVEIKTVNSPFTGKPMLPYRGTSSTFMHCDEIPNISGEGSG